jgi:hypothetical protein
MRKILAAMFALPLAAAPFAGDAAAQSSGVNVGVLTCSVEGGASFVFGSSRSLRCVLERSGGGKERYVGEIDKFGVDIGVTGNAVLVWTVVAPTSDVDATALSGNYAGVAADASIGVGGGANVLVGGSNRQISLQPLSVQAQTGLNAALTVASVKLKHVK